MQLSVRREPPEHLAGVLGVARQRGDAVEPRLRVFYGPLVRYLGAPNNASAIGRALARVAAHEAAHFLNQQAHHCAHGLLRARFPAYELVARDRWPFRHAEQCDPAGTGPGLGSEPLRADANQREGSAGAGSSIRWSQCSPALRTMAGRSRSKINPASIRSIPASETNPRYSALLL